MAPIAGWYDDPRDASRLRYWDGDEWTESVTERRPEPAAPQWLYPGAPPAQQQTWQYGGAPQPPQQTQPQPQPQPWPQVGPYGAPAAGPTTPDGVPITTWGKRLAARLLDLLVVGVGGLPFTGYFLYRTLQAVSDQVNNQAHPSLVPTADVVRWEAAFLAMFLVVHVAYETFCLDHWSATVGKRAMEISVRTYDRAGRLSWPTILRRVGFMFGLAALNLVPVISVPADILALVNYLWPLRDKDRQALHDKVARTVVVEGPRRTDGA